MTDEETPADARTISIAFSPDHSISITMEGGVTPDEMVLAAHYIERTADQVLDAQQATRQQRKPALEIVHSIPDHRNGA